MSAHRSTRLLPLLAFALPVTTGLAQVALRDLPALARERSARLRPAQEEALQPYWLDLALDYKDNKEHLDRRIDEVAKLGDGIVPLLLEKLQPAAGSEAARHTAANCRRVLEKLDPGSFLDALAELVRGTNEVARREAIALVGHAQGRRATQLLLEVFRQGVPEERIPLLQGFARQRATEVAAEVAPLLGSTDKRLREAALEYLVLAAPQSVVPTVLQALSAEKEDRLLPFYVEYLRAAAPEHDAAARTLLPLLTGDPLRLDWNDRKRLVKALAAIAPKGHDATTRKLHELLDSGDRTSLALEAALTLRVLGDKSGVKKFESMLSDLLRSPKHRREASLYEQRGNLYFALEEYRQAVEDYEKVLEHSESTSMRRRANIQLARCAATRNRWRDVLKHLQEGVPTHDELTALATQDPGIQEALQQKDIRAFYESLKKDG